MKININMNASIPLSGNLLNDEIQCIKLCRKVARKLGIKSNLKFCGAGTDFKTRDAGLIGLLTEKEAERILKDEKILKKLARYKEAKCKMDYLSIDVEVAGREFVLFTSIED